ncbi:hypothetical protein [Nannocystis radixulma]|uniref:Uncharacterized protein n=1 Tax=Nannocystis radixulma TaxID=2995305 RepID=A0ABT5BG08_9BACT|nr:hypothetical protein [Nannocystis radixulma]MDC0671901.1 hypothetical protein [Nannocystis radixulma]
MELRLTRAILWLGPDESVLGERAQQVRLREDGLAVRALPRAGAPQAPRRFAALRGVHQTSCPGWFVFLGAELGPGPTDSLDVQVVRSREAGLLNSATDEILDAACDGAAALRWAGVLRFAWGMAHEIDFMRWRFARAAATLAAMLAEETDDPARLRKRAELLWSGG